MSINFLPHPADIKMQVTAKNLPELFTEAVKGMFGIMNYELGIRNYEINRKMKIKSTDLTALLIDFLSEVLAQSDINDEIYQEIKFKKMTETEVGAELIGRPIKSKALEIKAVTYHQSAVKKVADGYEAIVVFDI